MEQRTLIGGLAIGGIALAAYYFLKKKHYPKDELVVGIHTIHCVMRRTFHFIEKKVHSMIENEEERKKDLNDILLLTTSLFGLLYVHHTGEDEVIFPNIAKHLAGKVDENAIHQLMTEHQDLFTNLKLAENLISELKSNPSKSKLQELEGIIKSIEALLFPHLRLEEKTLNWEVIQHLTQEQNDYINGSMDEEAKKLQNPQLIIPIAFFMSDNKQQSWFSVIFPWIIPNVMVPYVWKKDYQRLSRFFYNYNGQPRSPLFDLPNDYDNNVIHG